MDVFAAKATAVVIAGYTAAALLAGALATGGQRDGASASPSQGTGSPSAPAAGERSRFASLDELLDSDEDFSVARSFLNISGLAARLEDSRRRHTVFLPLDQAFADQQGVSDALARPSNSRALKRLLAFHVARGNRRLSEGTNVPTLGQDRLPIRSDGRRWWAQDARIIGGPLRFPGGRVYLIDAIMVAPGQRPPVSTATTVVSEAAP